MLLRLLIAGVVLLTAIRPSRADDPDVLRIGFVDSLLQEASPSQRKLLNNEFRKLVLDFTGKKCVVLEGLSPATAARQLERDKWHLGVFHGVEYAWLQAKFPQLKPLMVTTTAVSPVRAVLVVNKDSGITGSADLKGKNIAMLDNLHCRLFLTKEGGGSQNYFSNVAATRSVEDALDGILLGKVQAAVVDTPMLAFYKRIQSGRFARLKVVAQSEPFPPMVFVYRQGVLSDALLKHLQESMLKVKDSDRGREALEAFRVTGFERVPADFQQSLTRIARAYPQKESSDE